MKEFIEILFNLNISQNYFLPHIMYNMIQVMQYAALKWPDKYLLVPFEVNNLNNIRYVTKTNNLFLFDT